MANYNIDTIITPNGDTLKLVDNTKVAKAGDTMTGLLNISVSSGGNYNEGIRIHPFNGWGAITLCGSENTGDSGTSANTWLIGNNNGNFYLTRNGSSQSSSPAMLNCVNNAWSFKGNVSVENTIGINQSAGTSGGISLYAGTGYVDNYGICFRTTNNKGKHGYVQSDWATYLTMDGAETRGWVCKHTGNGNVASISGQGNLVLNGNITIGGNTTNTSGARLQYNSTTESVDFIFV